MIKDLIELIVEHLDMRSRVMVQRVSRDMDEVSRRGLRMELVRVEFTPVAGIPGPVEVDTVETDDEAEPFAKRFKIAGREPARPGSIQAGGEDWRIECERSRTPLPRLLNLRSTVVEICDAPDAASVARLLSASPPRRGRASTSESNDAKEFKEKTKAASAGSGRPNTPPTNGTVRPRVTQHPPPLELSLYRWWVRNDDAGLRTALREAAERARSLRWCAPDATVARAVEAIVGLKRLERLEMQLGPVMPHDLLELGQLCELERLEALKVWDHYEVGSGDTNATPAHLECLALGVCDLPQLRSLHIPRLWEALVETPGLASTFAVFFAEILARLPRLVDVGALPCRYDFWTTLTLRTPLPLWRPGTVNFKLVDTRVPSATDLAAFLQFAVAAYGRRSGFLAELVVLDYDGCQHGCDNFVTLFTCHHISGAHPLPTQASGPYHLGESPSSSSSSPRGGGEARGRAPPSADASCDGCDPCSPLNLLIAYNGFGHLDDEALVDHMAQHNLRLRVHRDIPIGILKELASSTSRPATA